MVLLFCLVFVLSLSIAIDRYHWLSNVAIVNSFTDLKLEFFVLIYQLFLKFCLRSESKAAQKVELLLIWEERTSKNS